MMEKILCAAIIAMMIGAFTPTVTADDPMPPAPPPYPLDTQFWIVTDGVKDNETQYHNFYDEWAPIIWSNHTQEWYYWDSMAWPSEIPIKDEDWWVNTSMECWAESDGDQTILHVKTYPANPGSIHLPEYINWTIINGNVSGNASYYIVNVIWTEFPDNKQSYEVNITIDDEGTEDFNLGYIQKLQMKLRYVDGTRSPGQKEYWIETDLDDIGGPPVDKSEQWHNWTDNWDECGQLESDGPHNLTWWTDYNGYNETIENATFHINTKVLAEVEALDGDLVLHVTVFGQSNYNDEIIKYTVGNGDDIGSDAYCYVTITGDDISTWTSENLVDGDFDFEELGNVQKPLSLTVYYMDPC